MLKTICPSIPQVDFVFVLGGQKVWGNYETDVPIDTKFGTRLRIHLGMVIG